MPRLLVTGALGNVGREVARACTAAGFTIRAANRDVEALRAALSDAEAVRFEDQIVLHVGLRRGDAEGVDPTVRAVLGRDPTPLETYLSRVGAVLRGP